MDLQAFLNGHSFDAYEYFGAHIEKGGVRFRVYAPEADRVTVMGDFSFWLEIPLKKLNAQGVFSGLVAGAKSGNRYKYNIYRGKKRYEHCDPYGFGMEMRPGNCSIIRELKSFKFSDSSWMKKRTKRFDEPMNIYELHLGSWKKKWRGFYRYDEIAFELIDYLKEHHYNYVEIMPLTEHPSDGSWGYLTTGYFSPTSRYGTVDQLKLLVDRLHRAGIGVIFDFVVAHFAKDTYALKKFGGTPLYEPVDPSRQVTEWHSMNFDYTKGSIRSFLQSAANYWLKEYHFDGIRMDAISRILYPGGDMQRGLIPEGEAFLRNMNQGLHALHPTAILIAEDSTSHPGVTRPAQWGGLGFDYKWGMGWMYDTMQYMGRSPYDRYGMRDKFTFSMYYFYDENFILSFSHDEVALGRKTIIDKLYGSYEEKFAQLRLLYLYMYSHPGKKLNFMGNELAMFREWDVRREPDWNILKMPIHNGFHKYFMELNRLYLKKSALSKKDYDRAGFAWLDCGCDNACTFGMARNCDGHYMVALFNFSDQDARCHIRYDGNVKILLHTDWEIYGGKTKKKILKALPDTIPAYSGMLFEQVNI